MYDVAGDEIAFSLVLSEALCGFIFVYFIFNLVCCNNTPDFFTKILLY